MMGSGLLENFRFPETLNSVVRLTVSMSLLVLNCLMDPWVENVRLMA